MKIFTKIKNCIADTVFTVKCPYCGNAINKNEYACEKCKSKFPYPSFTEYAIGGYKCSCRFPYKDIFRKAIINFKFYNKPNYAKQLAIVLTQSINEIYNNQKFDIITCVPMHKNKIKNRGYNQSQLLAKECAKLMDVLFMDTLIKTVDNKSQHSIKASQRGKNVKGVYKIKDKDIVNNKSILIIDDIITTGNTLGECSKILKKNNCKSVCCATLCATLLK